MKTKDLVSGALLLVFAVFVFVQSVAITSKVATGVDSGYFPERVSAVLAILAVIILFRAFRSRQAHEADMRSDDASAETPADEAGQANYYRPLGVLLVIVAYAALLTLLGFLPATLLFLLVVMPLLAAPGHRNWKTFVLTAVVVSVATQIIFSFGFGVILPEGVF